jgi:hypothetical protein
MSALKSAYAELVKLNPHQLDVNFVELALSETPFAAR